jgi:branched-chain amino acid transport system ATP-binding protein
MGIIGPNGAGKTTLLRVLAGEVEPSSGTLEWGGRAVRGHVSRRARQGLRKTFQHVESFGNLTVREHLAVPMTVHHTAPNIPVLQRFLEETGVLRQLDQPMDELPPAVARLVDIAMAIAARPRLLLLDEPFAGVSAAEGQAISHAVRQLKAQGTSIVIVEHRLHELFALANRVVVMHQGAAIADETPESVFHNPEVLAA